MGGRQVTVIWPWITVLVCIIVVLTGPNPAVARDRGIILPSHARTELLPNLMFAASLNLEFSHEKDFDLDNSVDDDLTTFEPELGVALKYAPNDSAMFFIEFELSKVYLLDSPPNTRDRDTQFELQQIYLRFKDKKTKSELTIGRQSFDDPLEWIYDEDLDGAQLLFERGLWAFEFSASREEAFIKDFFDPEPSDVINNYMALARYNVDKKTHVDFYVFRRDNQDPTDNEDDLTFLGIQSIGALGKQFSYWFNIAYVTGDNDLNGDDIRGFGFDVMGTYVFDRRWEPSVTAGIAFGTGDSDTTDGVDRNFRQSGLQDNNAKFNGLESFKYYGELFEPELANMTILTLGIGLKPKDNLSIDFVYHRYQQVRLDDDIRDSNINPDPNGLSKDLGQELDVIIGYRRSDRIRVEAVGGVFFPGSAFGPGADNAVFGSVELKLRY